MTDIDMFKDMTYDTLNKQVDGNHYSKMKVQPAYFLLMKTIYHSPKATPLSTYADIRIRVKRKI